MGSVLSSQKISSALEKAKNICIVEEAFEIGGNNLVVRNLRPAEYDLIIKSIAGFTNEAEYLNAWQKAYVCFALVEVNGIDFRGVDFIEVEEADSKGQKKLIKLETSTYLRDYLVSTWSKEAVYNIYRKVTDAISRAETESSSNIKFLVPEESPSDTFRRLVGELKEIEDEVPPTLVDAILAENGLMRKSTAEEIKAVMEKDSEAGWEEVQRKKQEAAAPHPPSVEKCEGMTFSPFGPKTPIPCELPKGHDGSHKGLNLLWEDPTPTPGESSPPAMERPDTSKRQPLNQMVVDVPAPPLVQREVVPAPRPKTKAEEFAALETDADQIGAIPRDIITGAVTDETPELSHRQTGVNTREVMADLDKQPRVGLNPKFRPLR